VAEHELVHAYCHLTFGTCGPEWYKEGMADVAARSGRGGGAVNCPPEVVRLLRQERGKSIRDIVIARRFTEPIADRMDEIHEAQSTGDLAKNQWLAADDEIVAKARQSYDWSWSLCHFLCNNPNYRDRFRMLGMGYLSQSDVSFQQLFGPVADQLMFEYGLFLRDVDNGYRVDLCGWDWQQEFLEIEATETISSLVKASWGYQPSRLLVSAGQEYDYTAVGSWTTGAGRLETSADGDDNGRGRLIGVILQGYSLGEPFELGAGGSFVARNGGRLYLRCGDAWHELGDNAGRVTIQWQKKQRGSSLESRLQPAEAGTPTDPGGP
jgi:hypothetical protein